MFLRAVAFRLRFVCGASVAVAGSCPVRCGVAACCLALLSLKDVAGHAGGFFFLFSFLLCTNVFIRR